MADSLIHFRKSVPKVALFFLAMSENAFAAKAELNTNVMGDPFYLLFFLIGISLLPFIAVMVTSFAKIVIVLSIARQAIGTAQAPPNIVIISLSMILTLFSMYPVLKQIEQNLAGIKWAEIESRVALEKIFIGSKEPIRSHLQKHAQVKDQELFLSLINKNVGDKEKAQASDFIVLAPAF